MWTYFRTPKCHVKKKTAISVLEIMLVSQKPNGNSWKEKTFIKLKKEVNSVTLATANFQWYLSKQSNLEKLLSEFPSRDYSQLQKVASPKVASSLGLPASSNWLMQSMKAPAPCISAGPSLLQSSIWGWLTKSQSDFFLCPLLLLSLPAQVLIQENTFRHTFPALPQSLLQRNQTVGASGLRKQMLRWSVRSESPDGQPATRTPDLVVVGATDCPWQEAVIQALKFLLVVN